VIGLSRMRDLQPEVTLTQRSHFSSKSNAMQEFEISFHGSEGERVNEAPRSSSRSDRRAPLAANGAGSDPELGPPAAVAGGYDTGSDPVLDVVPVDDRRIGQVIDGKYHVLRRLACGGMGSVYEARHVVVGRHVALKFLHEQYAQRSCMVQRFLREAQAAGSIASEHIIGVLDYGTTEGTPYLVMELVRGKDLREILSESPRLSTTRAVRIVLDACRGLSLAHERGLVHRDLKPANICVTRRSDGREVAKVIDFGVAKLRDGAELSEEGTLIGTLGYMAPEQLTDQKELDARADIYALGVILYQALSGRPPHLCNRSELLYRIVSVDPRPLAELCPDLPRGLTQVVHKALCRNKERRYANVQELAQALEPFAGDDTVHGWRAGAPSRADDWRAGATNAASSWSSADPASEGGVRALLQPTENLPHGSGAPGATHSGTEETELGRAPTWAAVARATNLKADRQCGGMEALRGARVGSEEYCRHPDGLPPPPVPTRHQHLSQRALLLSVGALALSVVAMTTMFIFVYSHGSGALEAAAKTSSRTSARSMAAALPPDRCPAPNRPLHPASVLEFGADDETGIRVERHSLTPSLGARAIECE
jgi:eukaryotic-like serine/threonine-protein kinase